MKILAIPGTLFFTILLILSSFGLYAQMSKDDSLYYEKAISNSIAVYHQNIGDQSGLFNGSQYGGYNFSFYLNRHPYFLTTEWSYGSIVYDNVFYDNVELLYDEAQELVIFQDKKHKIQLVPERISGFSIAGNNFVRLEKDDSLASSLVRNGFYNLLYNGKVQVLKKEVKVLKEDLRSTAEGILHFVDVSTYYYIKKNNEYFPVNGKKSVLDIYRDKKKELQQYIKTNKLRYGRDRDTMLVKVSAWYDQLTK